MTSVVAVVIVMIVVLVVIPVPVLVLVLGCDRVDVLSRNSDFAQPSCCHDIIFQWPRRQLRGNTRHAIITAIVGTKATDNFFPINLFSYSP